MLGGVGSVVSENASGSVLSKSPGEVSSVLKNDKTLGILISNLHFHRQKPQNRPRTAPLSMEMQVVVGESC